MKMALIGQLILFISIVAQAQLVTSYEIDVHFFPDDAQMWGNPVSSENFMRADARVELSGVNSDKPAFYLHGELKIDSIVSGTSRLDYTSRKVFYPFDYSYIALETTINTPGLISGNTIHVYYSGFFNPSKARSLSEYTFISKEKGVYLRAYHYSPWFPIFENPDRDDYTVNFREVTVKLPKNFKAVISGELMKESVIDEHYIATWKPGLTEISNVQISAREYEVISGQDIYVHYVGSKQNGVEIIEFASSLKDFYSSHLKNVNGTSSLHIIEMPEYGDISCQNVIGISTKVYENFDSEQYSRLTIAHELVHPYVTVPVTGDNPFYVFVIEGFPSFFHLYGMDRILGSKEFDVEKYMKQVEDGYLRKKETGKDRRGNPLPAEKPILKISFTEIGQYKDAFILPDRARLFLYHLWTTMGDNKYDQFLRELFLLESIDYDSFGKLVVKYIPGYEENLNTWLNTNEYPEAIRINER